MHDLKHTILFESLDTMNQVIDCCHGMPQRSFKWTWSLRRARESYIETYGALAKEVCGSLLVLRRLEALWNLSQDLASRCQI